VKRLACAFAALCFWLAACDGRVDPQLVDEATPDGGVVAVQQALGTYAQFYEQMELDFGITERIHIAALNAFSSMGQFLYMGSPNIAAELWAKDDTHDWHFVSSSLVQIHPPEEGYANEQMSGFRRCNPFTGCTPIIYTVPLYKKFGVSMGFPRSYGRWVKYLYYWDPGSGRPWVTIGFGETQTVSNLPDTSGSTPFWVSHIGGIFGDPDNWSRIAAASGQPTNWHDIHSYYDCGPGGVGDDHCQQWPGNQSCDPVPPGVCQD
jgi:hypothetical protein